MPSTLRVYVVLKRDHILLEENTQIMLRVFAALGSLALLSPSLYLGARGASAAPYRSCDLVDVAHGKACRCNETFCDNVPTLDVQEGATYAFALYDKSWKRLEVQKPTPPTSAPKYDRQIRMNTSRTFQKILGFGNAITDAAAIGFNKMTPTIQKQILEQYWGASSAKFSIGRVPIASTDFSTHVYSYDDVPGDTSLAHFSIAVDKNMSATGNKLGLLKSVLAKVKDTGYDINLFASIWAPPAWMTDTGKTTGNPKLKKWYGSTIRPVYY